MAEPFHDLDYPYQPFYPSPAPLFSPYQRSNTPLDLPRDFRPVFPVLRDLTDEELLNLTDLVLFERQRQHVETMREKGRYLDRLTSFLEQEAKFGVGDLFAPDELPDSPGTPPEAVASSALPAKAVPADPELENGESSSSERPPESYFIDSLPLPMTYGAFPPAPPSIVSFYQPLYTPPQSGGAKYSPRSLHDPRPFAILNSIPPLDTPANYASGKGKSRPAATLPKKSKPSTKQADPEIEKRWVSYFQSRFRYRWEMEQTDSSIRILETAVEGVIQRKRGRIARGGGLRRETLADVTRLRDLRIGGRKRAGNFLSIKAGPATSGELLQGPITKLPTELLHQIFSYFRAPHLASTHALICRRWNAIATPIVYKKIPFGDYMEDYWVEVGRRKRIWRKKQEENEKDSGKEKGAYELPKNYSSGYIHGDRISRMSGAGWGARHGVLRHDCGSDDEGEVEFGGADGDEDFYPDGKQGGTFPVGGPALVVMPWSMGIIRAIGNPHLAKHVRHITYQASSYTSFPNHNEASKVFTDVADMRPMFDQRFRTLNKLLLLVRKAVRVCTRVESIELNSGDERISNALLGLLKWSPRVENLSIINTNLRLLQFSRGVGKGQEGLMSRGGGKGKGRARPREEDGEGGGEGATPDGGFRRYLIDTQNLNEPLKTGQKVKIKSAPPGPQFYFPNIKRVLLFRCGYHPMPQKDSALIEPAVRHTPRNAHGDRAQASRERERRRRKRIRARAKVARGEKRALEKIVLFLQRCSALEELKVKGCQFLPEALVDSTLIWELEGGTAEEAPLTMGKLQSLTIRSCGTYLHDRTPDIWLSSAPFESFFLRHKCITHLGWNGWILNRHLPLEDPVFSRVVTHLGRTVTSLSIAHGYDEEVARTAAESFHRVRLSLKRFNLLLRHLRHLDSLDWRMFYLPMSKMMMCIRNLRHCRKLRQLRIEGVVGVISPDEARELVAALPALEKLRVGWRPRPSGYRRGRGGPQMSPFHQPPIWSDDLIMDYDSPPSPAFPMPPPHPPPPMPMPIPLPMPMPLPLPMPMPMPMPMPPVAVDSDYEDDDWGGETGREPEWVAAEEVARIFAELVALRELVVNICIAMPASVEKSAVAMGYRVTDEILRPVTGGSTLRKRWLEKIRETAVAFARCSPSGLRKVGLGYFIGVEGLRAVVRLDRDAAGTVVGWSADLRGGRVGECWKGGVEEGIGRGGEAWMEGALRGGKEVWGCELLARGYGRRVV